MDSRTPPEQEHGPLEALENRVDAVIDAVKPKLRGWLHVGMAPLAFLGGLVLVIFADTWQARLSAAVFTVTAVLLFGISAVYHRGRWSPRTTAILKRFDHANIFLIIAGTYTPFALLLPRFEATTLLVTVWTGAILGVLFRIFWLGAPRWLYVPIYVALGWVAVFYIGPLFQRFGAAVVTLIVVGGVLYSLGAVVYGIKRPDPSPRWFGFHEVFHSLTILAFVSHYIAASMALWTLPA